MAFDEMIRSLGLENETERGIIAAHLHELTEAENSALGQIGEKNGMIEDLQRQIDDLRSQIAENGAKAARGISYEPPVIKVVKYG